MRLISAGSLVRVQSRPPAFARSEAECEATAPEPRGEGGLVLREKLVSYGLASHHLQNETVFTGADCPGSKSSGKKVRDVL